MALVLALTSPRVLGAHTEKTPRLTPALLLVPGDMVLLVPWVLQRPRGCRGSHRLGGGKTRDG